MNNRITILFPGDSTRAPRLQRFIHVYSKIKKIEIIVIDINELTNPKYVKLPILNVLNKQILNYNHITKKNIFLNVLFYTAYCLSSIIYLIKLNIKHNILAIHCSHLHSMIIGMLCKYIFKTILIYDVYEFYYLYFKKRIPLFVKLFYKFEGMAAKKSDLIVPWWFTISTFLELNYNVTNIFTFPNIPPYDLFTNNKNDSCQNLLINDDDFVILYTGRFVEHYKLRELVLSIKLFGEKSKNIKVMFVGSGPLKQTLVQLALNENVEKNIIFIDRVPYDEISYYYNICDVVYAIYEPVFDHLMLPAGKIFESMMSKKPVITINKGEKKRLVEKAQCGITINPCIKEIYNAILYLYDNPRMKEHMGESGHLYLERYLNWNTYEKDYLTLLKSVINFKKHLLV